MSDSYKKTPKHGYTMAKSEKKNKQEANRRLRRTNKILLFQDKEPKELREVSDVWCFDKDGKWYDTDNKHEKLKRK